MLERLETSESRRCLYGWGQEFGAKELGGVLLMINDTNMKDVLGVFHSRVHCFDCPFLSLGINLPTRHEELNVIVQKHSEKAPGGITGKLLLTT